jgi:hypothetical protein
MAEKARQPGAKVRFGVEYDGKPEGDIKLTAYAFDGRGTFLGSAGVKQGVAELPLRGDAAGSARIFFGPELRDPKQPPTFEDMERLGAYEPAWRYDARLDIQKLLPIPEAYYHWWHFCSCRVRGQVVRPIKIGSVTVNYPVQNARVHICEVDKIKLWIDRIPDRDIFRLRDELLEKLYERVRIPIPIPDPPPYEIFLKTPIEVGGPSPVELAGLNPQPLPPKEIDQMRLMRFEQRSAVGAVGDRLERVALNPQPLPPREASIYDSLDTSVKTALRSSSASVLRKTLVDYASIFSPFWCYFPWIYYWWRCDEVAVVETDGQGRFDTTIYYQCPGDHPDLYFWVEYFVDGQWVTVYDPGIPCNTYWDYVCGSDVTITVTDPRVPGIPGGVDLGFKGLLVTTIGSGVCVKDVPTSGAGVGLFGDAPFGSTLDLRADFGMTDLRAAGIVYYLWSYKRLTTSDGTTPVSDSWHAFTEPVIRHYQFPPPSPTSGPNYVAYTLGPKPNGLYEIPPALIPGAIRMAIISEADLATGYFVTPGSSGPNPDGVAGLYALKLELFDSAGNAINWTTQGVDVFIPNISAPLNTSFGTHHAPNGNRILGGVSGTDTLAFQMVVHVDNNPVVAVLHTVELNGSPANPNCGFLEYGDASSDLVSLSFQAHHPHGFATFGNGVYRGLGIGLPTANASGKVTDTNATNPAGINGYARVGAGEYSKSILIATMLSENTPDGLTPCSQAAFSQNLAVYAMAINGYGRLQHLDRGGVQAFALAEA